jgi:hypothetical protein
MKTQLYLFKMMLYVTELLYIFLSVNIVFTIAQLF